MNFCQIVRQELHVFAGAVFQNESESAGGADAGNGGRREAQRESIGQLGKLLIHVLHDLADIASRGWCALSSRSSVTKKNPV